MEIDTNWTTYLSNHDFKIVYWIPRHTPEAGADAETDHNLVVARIRVKLKIVYKGRNKKHWTTDSLKESDKLMAFIEKLENKIEQQFCWIFYISPSWLLILLYLLCLSFLYAYLQAL